MRYLIKIFILLFLLKETAFADVALNFIITLKDNVVEVSEREVSIKDIALVASHNEPLIKKIGELLVGSSPKTGLKRVFSKYEIIRALRKNQIDTENIKIDGALKTTVIRPSTVITTQMIQEKASDFIISSLNLDINNSSLEMQNNFKDIYLEKTPVEFDFSFASDEEIKSVLILNLKLLQNGDVKKTFHISMKLKVYDYLFVANRKIAKGDKIRVSDIISKKLDITKIAKVTFISENEIIGKMALSNINKGSIIKYRLIGKPVVIRKNQMVFMEVHKGPLRISMQGKALSKGCEGDVIQVKNISSGRIISGVVKNSSTITVGLL